ncbi:hypothetical protein [Campylobacter sp. 19-13652]|uniref:hypothetical protein n=1 Tax=Campylobacter sp. 19-13652 TaxID=2840180 RepID=UPI001C76B21B|nr:hypothetical protein [Campylobacter sp. 19-13652]BCX79957.1 hypothetical protein LBC_14190 [Campylobacter sp. 19-13652]
MQTNTDVQGVSLMGLYASLNEYARELNKNPDEMLAQAIEDYLDRLDLAIAESRLGEQSLNADEARRFINEL